MLHGESDLETLVDANSPDILLLDGREGPSRAQLEKLKRGVAVTAVIDDGHDRRKAADLAYYPPVPGAKALDWSGANTLIRIGWEWSLLGLNINAVPARAPSSRPTVLVAMGGSDPHGLTLRMGKALSGLEPGLRIRFVIGTGMKDGAQVARGLVALRSNYETIEGADDLTTEYASADLALCAFGVTAYELATLGIPAIYLGLTDDHAASASAFNDRPALRIARGAGTDEQAPGAARDAQCRSVVDGWSWRGAHRRRSVGSAAAGQGPRGLNQFRFYLREDIARC